MIALIGDICMPKTEAIIVPDDGVGTLRSILGPRGASVALGGILKESRKYLRENKVELGDCFVTGPGRLLKRRVKKVYHVVIKLLKSDYTSLYYVEKGVDNAFKKVIQDKMQSVAICGLGIDQGDLDPISVAGLFFNICTKYNSKIKIKIIDTNEEFINEIKKRLIGTIYENSG